MSMLNEVKIRPLEWEKETLIIVGVFLGTCAHNVMVAPCNIPW